jgi:hypothetical protein
MNYEVRIKKENRDYPEIFFPHPSSLFLHP